MRIYTRMIPMLFIGIAFMTLSSCEKKAKSDPVNVLTDERTMGKWEVIGLHIADYREDTLFNLSEYLKDIGQIENGTRVQDWVAQYHTTYLTLQSDHSFFHLDYDGNYNGHMLALFLPDQGGTWALKSPSQLELTTLSFEDGKTQKQMTWDVAGYDGSYMNISTLDTYTYYGAKAATMVLLELERQ